jgi:molecular chaperone DnaK
MKGDDKTAIDTKAQTLATVAQKLGEKVYADAQAKNGPSAGAGPQSQPAGEGTAQEKEVEGNVVDAEYTEVKDKKSA